MISISSTDSTAPGSRSELTFASVAPFGVGEAGAGTELRGTMPKMGGPRFWQLADADWLREQHLERGRTLTDIAREVGCTRASVGQAMQRHGVRDVRGPGPVRKLTDTEWLRAVYVDQRMTTSQIAAALGCTKQPVLRALVLAGIPRRRRGARDPWAPPKRQPRVIGVGVDAVDIERFRESLARTPSMRVRLFTESELADVGRRADPVPGLAARFAAREAVMKAMGLGLGAFGFHEVWVVKASSGAPSLMITGRAAALADERGISEWLLSITHTDLVAIAHVVAQ